jgi:thioredoxin-dependent peroxiredoxin
MSKKTRKKSPKSRSGKATRASSKTSKKSAAKTAGDSSRKVSRKVSRKASKKAASKTPKATAKKSRKSAVKKPDKAAVKALHKAPSKTLKSSAPLGAATESETPVAKPAAANPPAGKPPGGKTDASNTRKAVLAEGSPAPAFRLPRDGGETVSLADFSGKKLVLFFYPRADTPGCTREAIDFTRLADAFAEIDTTVLGVSADPVKAQESFRDKHQLRVPLVSDENHEMLESYGVWGEKSMYGKTFLGILRTTVLIGADGLVARIWRHVKVDGHADDVLAAARAL